MTKLIVNRHRMAEVSYPSHDHAMNRVQLV